MVYIKLIESARTKWPGRGDHSPQLAAAATSRTKPASKAKEIKTPASTKPLTPFQKHCLEKRREAWREKVGKKFGSHQTRDDLYNSLSDAQKESVHYYAAKKILAEQDTQGRIDSKLITDARSELAAHQAEFETWAKDEWAEEAARLSRIRDWFDTCMEEFIAISKNEDLPQKARDAADQRIEALQEVWDKGNFANPAWGPSDTVLDEVRLLKPLPPYAEPVEEGDKEKPILLDGDSG